MRRLVVLLLSSIILLTALVGAATAAGKYEGEQMAVYVGVSPYGREHIMTYIAPILQEKYGIDLIIEEMGAKDMLQKVTLSKESPSVSVCVWDTFIGMQAMQMGLTAPLDPSVVTNMEELYDWALITQDGEIHVVIRSLTAVGLIYNTDRFEELELDPPDSWYDLWLPELAGRVSITAPESTWGTLFLYSLAVEEGGGVDDITPSVDKLETLLPNMHTIHTWSSELGNLLQLDEVWLATTGSSFGASLAAQGFPAAWVAPKEGSPLSSGGLSIIKNAPYQDVAQDFAQLFLDETYMLRRALWAGVAPPHKGVWTVLSPNETARMPISIDDFDKLVNVDWNSIAVVRNDWIEFFHRQLSN